MVPAAEHPSRLPQRWAKAPRGAGQPRDADSLPSGQQGADDSCQPGGPSGKLLRTQRAWKPWLPICWPGKRWAAEEPRLPAPVGWSWEAGRASHRSLPGVSATLAGAGEPQTLSEPLSYFRKSTWGGTSLAHQEITVLQAAIAKLSLNHISSQAVAALYQMAGASCGFMAVRHLLRLWRAAAPVALPAPASTLPGHR